MPSRSNSTRSRKHSAPVQIHALLRTSTDSENDVKHGHHRRGASLSANATVSPTPVDRPAVAMAPHPALKKNEIGSAVTRPRPELNGSNGYGDDTHTSPSPTVASQTRQRSHSYASAPLSTLVTHLDSPSLASFTPADVHPCATGSLRRCQWMLRMNAYGTWYHDGDDYESADYIQPHEQIDATKNPVPSPTTAVPPPSLQKKKPKLTLPSRLWKKFSSASDGVINNKRSDSETEFNEGVDRDYGEDDTPSLSPRSSRHSSRSRGSASPSASISPSSPSIPSITRRHSGFGDGPLSSLSVTLGRTAAGASTTPSTMAVRCESKAKIALSIPSGSSSALKTGSRHDPNVMPGEYKYVPTVEITAKQTQLRAKTPDMSTERILPATTTTPKMTNSSLSPPLRTLRSSKKRTSISHTTTSALPSLADLRVPFPVPSATTDNTITSNALYSNTYSSHPPSSPTTRNPKTLLTLSDLERTSKLMRSTTTCAACGRSGSDFSRCPRTGVAWCSRACRILAKKNIGLTTS